MTDRPNFIQGRRNVLELGDLSSLVPTGPPSLTEIWFNKRSFCPHQFFRHSGGPTLLVLRLVWTPTFDFYCEKKSSRTFYFNLVFVEITKKSWHTLDSGIDVAPLNRHPPYHKIAHIFKKKYVLPSLIRRKVQKLISVPLCLFRSLEYLKVR